MALRVSEHVFHELHEEIVRIEIRCVRYGIFSSPTSKEFLTSVNC